MQVLKLKYYTEFFLMLKVKEPQLFASHCWRVPIEDPSGTCAGGGSVVALEACEDSNDEHYGMIINPQRACTRGLQ